MSEIVFDKRKSVDQVEESTELAPKFDDNGIIRRIRPIPSANSGLRATGKAMILARAKRCKTPKRTYAFGAKI